jgi:hypothetical protein
MIKLISVLFPICIFHSPNKKNIVFPVPVAEETLCKNHGLILSARAVLLLCLCKVWNKISLQIFTSLVLSAESMLGLIYQTGRSILKLLLIKMTPYFFTQKVVSNLVRTLMVRLTCLQKELLLCQAL